MNCPKCGLELRESKKYPGCGMCDRCRKRCKLLPEAVITQTDGDSINSNDKSKGSKRGKLRTAEEMYQYCLNNSFGKGMTQNWGIKHFRLIEQSLASDEEVLMCFIGLHNYISATKHDNNFAYAITNKRIIMAQQRVLGQSFQTVSLKNVNDITFKKGILMGIIAIDTIKEEFNVGVDSGAGQNINNVIHDLLLTLQHEKIPQEPQVKTVSDADEILKFKSLLDAGIITQEEFKAKKQQLLGL